MKYHPVNDLQVWAGELERIAEAQAEPEAEALDLESCDFLDSIAAFLRSLSVGEVVISAD
jgi:hypothetical protein